MAFDVTESLAPASHVPPGAGLVLWLRAQLAAPSLDARLVAGEDPHADAVLAHRCRRLASRRKRRRIAAAVDRVSTERPERAGFSAAMPVEFTAVKIARPALEQLASALRSRRSVDPLGVALSKALLTEPCSALYQPAYPEQLYEVARNALLALGPDADA
jgi:hypothetical protein